MPDCKADGFGCSGSIQNRRDSVHIHSLIENESKSKEIPVETDGFRCSSAVPSKNCQVVIEMVKSQYVPLGGAGMINSFASWRKTYSGGKHIKATTLECCSLFFNTNVQLF